MELANNSDLPDVQLIRDEREIAINRVAVTPIGYPIQFASVASSDARPQPTVASFEMFSMVPFNIILHVACMFAVTLIGCTQPVSSETKESPSLSVVHGSQLESYVAQSDVPVLVEFGVDFQCERCRQMKSPVVDLAERFKGKADVIRVDFSANSAMVSRLGGTICPTYVLYCDGKPVKTASFPISTDILESHLIEVTD